jgi:PAT family beta-lactamase induction signal transducer AmpG
MSSSSIARAEKAPAVSIWNVFASWRIAVVFLHGFVAGIPLALSAGTLQAWLKDIKVDLTLIGLFSLVGMPYTLKFLWAPLMDRYIPPLLGRRRGWIVICQLVIICWLMAMAVVNPATMPGLMAVLAFLLAFSSASQDIVIDAYRVDVLAPEEYGAGTAVYVTGYRIAMIVSGAGALVLSDHMPWRVV